MKLGAVARKAMRAGARGALDRALQVARLRAERKAAGRAQGETQLWAHLNPRSAAARAACRAAAQGDNERAQCLLLDAMRQRPALLPALAAADAALSAESARFPGAAAAIIAGADRSLAHRFTLFGWMEVDAGTEINWLRDPATGAVSPLNFWADLDNSALNLRVLWEINRHQHLLDLARACRLTGDLRYADEAGKEMRSWISQNPYSQGANWASSLEVALRAIAWLWTHALLLPTDGMTPALNAEIVAALRGAGAHVARHLSYTFSPNTHLLGEALGLAYLGAALPELREARCWFVVGRRLLIREAQRQFLPDGFHFEHSTWYHRFATDIYLHAAVVCRLAGQPLPGFTLKRIEQMLECLAALGAVGGDTIPMGDDDGGMLLPLAHIAPGDFRDTMAVGAALFGRGDLKPESAEPAEAVLWLLGERGLSQYDALAPVAPQSTRSRILPGVGLMIMQGEAGLRFAFDCGDRAAAESAHDHADALSVQLRSADGPRLVDSGTYTYVGAEGWRDYFRGTAAHNTVVIDGRGQAEAQGPFAWRDAGHLRRREWFVNPGFDLGEGEYRHHRPLDGVTQVRRVFYVKPDYWVICDVVGGRGAHDLEQWFHFPPCPATLEGEAWCEAQTPGGPVLIAPLCKQVEARMVEGEEQPLQGWVSDAFGRKSAAPALCYHVRTALPALMPTLISARKDGGRPTIRALEADPESAVAAVTVQWPGWQDHILLAPGDGRRRVLGAFATDARAVCVRESLSGEIMAVSLCGATFLGYRGVGLVALPRRADHFHAARAGDSVSIWGTVSAAHLGWAAASAALNCRPAALEASATGVWVKAVPA